MQTNACDYVSIGMERVQIVAKLGKYVQIRIGMYIPKDRG